MRDEIQNMRELVKYFGADAPFTTFAACPHCCDPVMGFCGLFECVACGANWSELEYDELASQQ